MKVQLKRCLALFAGLALSASAQALPKGVAAIGEIDITKYAGKWFEIARMDFVFERGLINTSAEYSLLANGKLKVVNQGYDPKRDKFKKAVGKARFRTAARNGELEVSFFGPFYGEYNIIALDAEYRYALVVGNNAKYMWILSRERTLPEEIKTEYLAIAQSAGIDTDKLIWVEQKD